MDGSSRVSLSSSSSPYPPPGTMSWRDYVADRGTTPATSVAMPTVEKEPWGGVCRLRFEGAGEASGCSTSRRHLRALTCQRHINFSSARGLGRQNNWDLLEWLRNLLRGFDTYLLHCSSMSPGCAGTKAPGWLGCDRLVTGAYSGAGPQSVLWFLSTPADPLGLESRPPIEVREYACRHRCCATPPPYSFRFPNPAEDKATRWKTIKMCTARVDPLPAPYLVSHQVRTADGREVLARQQLSVTRASTHVPCSSQQGVGTRTKICAEKSDSGKSRGFERGRQAALIMPLRHILRMLHSVRHCRIMLPICSSSFSPGATRKFQRGQRLGPFPTRDGGQGREHGSFFVGAPPRLPRPRRGSPCYCQ